MAAEDPSESSVSHHDSTAPGAGTETALTLGADVLDWLAMRLAQTSRTVTLVVSALPGRWVLRWEHGASASVFEQPSRRDYAAAEVASAVRRWARGAGASSKVERGQGAEVRMTLSPPALNAS